jgi:predicted nucleotide-binding protein
MNTIEQLKARINTRLDDPTASVTGIVQDCLTLSRLLGYSEWEIYFKAQLSGLLEKDRPTPTPREIFHKESVRWYPLEAFMEDRKLFESHSIEMIEQITKKIDEGSLQSPFRYFALLDLDFLLREVEETQQINRSVVEMRQAIAKARTRARQFISEVESLTTTDPSTAPRRVIFLGHGRSAIWKELAHFLKERLGLEYDEFNRTSTAGKTTITRLQEMLDRAGFAFLIFTAEDQQTDGSFQARQNVVQEAGLFQGRLGFERAIILLEEGCQEFSNIFGLGQIRFPKGNLMAKSEEIRQVLEREGLIYQAQKTAV